MGLFLDVLSILARKFTGFILTNKLNRYFGFAALLLTLLSVGCGRSEVELGSVSGRVTLDEKPLSGIFIIFQPEKGRPALAILDKDGKFTLQYNVHHSGALVGKQDVYLKTPLSDQLDEVRQLGIEEPSTFPKKFSQVFETLEVKSGRNFFNLNLKSS
jgi:hypothetical protein